MLNALRLKHGFQTRLFHDNTGLLLDSLLPGLELARDKGLIDFSYEKISPTRLGFYHLNDLQALFLQHKKAKRKPFFDSTEGIIHN